MHSTLTACPACHSPYAAGEIICGSCGLLFASYTPAAGSTTLQMSSSAFSPDGQLIAIDSPGEQGPQVKLWRMANF